ncbi:hypothetical protein NDU88_006434 [Pleurodeles waltl]|uniref:Uncharacterized protein n=1 Tax=Pleurodeles waltl TaxID=8319 RepID=A0AAV7RMH7_PLEWA|nr:hypothetical protein NDU88_006434 [Pleurodeles waltl]
MQPGCVADWGGLDRQRVGERLQATLARPQELHLLRSQQQELVVWALAMNPTVGAPAQPGVAARNCAYRAV